MSTEAADTQAIVVQYRLKRAPSLVWRALTEPALLARWLMENDIAPVVGHRFTLKAQPMPGWDGTVHCEVLEVETERRLRYSWRGGPDAHSGFGGPIDTEVAWTLAPSGDGGTVLTLEHSGFRPKDAFAFEGLGKGWRGGRMLERLEQVVDGT